MEQLVRLEFPNLWLVLPELIVLLTGFILFSLDLIYKRINHSVAISVSLIGYIIALLFLILNPNMKGETFYGLYHRDSS